MARSPRPPKAPAAAKVSKSDFVRSLPADLPASEVIARGKARGITLAANHVYVIRQRMRAGGRKARAPRSAKVARAVAAIVQGAHTPSTDGVRTLRQLIGELGTHTVAQELASFRNRNGV